MNEYQFDLFTTAGFRAGQPFDTKTFIADSEFEALAALLAKVFCREDMKDLAVDYGGTKGRLNASANGFHITRHNAISPSHWRDGS